jgi:hypothetical protein
VVTLSAGLASPDYLFFLSLFPNKENLPSRNAFIDSSGNLNSLSYCKGGKHDPLTRTVALLDSGLVMLTPSIFAGIIVANHRGAEEQLSYKRHSANNVQCTCSLHETNP